MNCDIVYNITSEKEKESRHSRATTQLYTINKCEPSLSLSLSLSASQRALTFLEFRSLSLLTIVPVRERDRKTIGIVAAVVERIREEHETERIGST